MTVYNLLEASGEFVVIKKDGTSQGTVKGAPSGSSTTNPTVPPSGVFARPGTGDDSFGDDRQVPAVDEQLAADGASVEERFDLTGPEGRAWRVATSMVNRFKPVPWLLWTIIRGVYGRSGEIGSPDPMSFSPVEKLLLNAVRDRTLGKKELPERISLSDAVKLLGTDVAGSLCYIHAVSRRVGSVLNEKVARPIIDDALLRTFIGYQAGLHSKVAGAGRGMIAGFSGRSGLAIQIASGTLEQAQKALAGLASGVEISKVCTDIYGCDPLKVAALSLIAGGCSRDVAYGIAAYSSKRNDVVPGTEQFMWLSLFSLIEALRMSRSEQVSEVTWKELGYDPAARAALVDVITQAQRRGHGWRWITQPQSEPAAAGEKKPE